MAASSAFKCEGIRYHTYSKDASILGHTGNHGCCACASTSSHAGCDEDLQTESATYIYACTGDGRCSQTLCTPCLRCQQKTPVPPRTPVLLARQAQGCHPFLQAKPVLISSLDQLRKLCSSQQCHEANVTRCCKHCSTCWGYVQSALPRPRVSSDPI